MGNQVCAVFEFDSQEASTTTIQESKTPKKSFKKCFSQEDEFSALERENLWRSSNEYQYKPSTKNIYPYGDSVSKEKLRDYRIFEVQNYFYQKKLQITK